MTPVPSPSPSGRYSRSPPEKTPASIPGHLRPAGRVAATSDKRLAGRAIRIPPTRRDLANPAIAASGWHEWLAQMACFAPQSIYTTKSDCRYTELGTGKRLTAPPPAPGHGSGSVNYRCAVAKCAERRPRKLILRRL